MPIRIFEDRFNVPVFVPIHKQPFGRMRLRVPAEAMAKASSSLENLLDSTYWSGEEFNRTRAYSFDVADGARAHAKKRDGYYGLAVRDGHVTATPVPVPAAILLLGSGLAGLGLLGMRIRQRTS